MSHPNPDHWSNKWDIVQEKFKSSNGFSTTIDDILRLTEKLPEAKQERLSRGLPLPTFLPEAERNSLSEIHGQACKDLGIFQVVSPDGKPGIGIPVSSPRHMMFFIHVLDAANKLEAEEPSFEALYAAQQAFENEMMAPESFTKVFNAAVVFAAHLMRLTSMWEMINDNIKEAQK